MVLKNIELLNYINSLPGLTNQQKSKIADSAFSMEDVSIMLSNIKTLQDEGTVGGDKNRNTSTSVENGASESIWNGPSETNPGRSLIDTFGGKGEKLEKPGVITELVQREHYNNGKIKKEYLTKCDKNGTVMSKKSVEYKYNSNGKIVEETGSNFGENNKAVKSYTTNNEYDKQGKLFKSLTKKYDTKGHFVSSELLETEHIQKDNLLRETKSTYDKNGKIFTQTVDDTYRSEKGEKLKNTWQYFEKEKLKHELISENDKSGMEIRTTEKLYNDGAIVEKTVDEDSEPSVSTKEYYNSGKVVAKKRTITNYDDNGSIVKEIIENQDSSGNVLSKNNIVRKFNISRQETDIVEENFDSKNKFLGKTVNSIQRDSADNRTSETSEVYDANGAMKSKISTKYKTQHGMNFLSSQTKINYKDGKEFSVETIEESDVEGEYQYRVRDDKGKITNIVDVRKTENGTIIAKKLESPDGTRTDYHYSEDDKGNKKLLYKVFDKDNKELMSTSREYQWINEGLALSKVDGKEYRIERNGNNVKVFDIANKKYTSVDLNALVKGDNLELKEIIASQPGDLLVGLTKEVNRIFSENHNGAYYNDGEYLLLDNKASTVAHEYGHAVDSVPNALNQNESTLLSNQEFLSTYNKEYENFKNSSTEADSEAFSYLESRNEFVAEAKMVTTARGDKNWNSMRELMLMKYFPKSIVIVSQKLKEIENGEGQKKLF